MKNSMGGGIKILTLFIIVLSLIAILGIQEAVSVCCHKSRRTFNCGDCNVYSTGCCGTGSCNIFCCNCGNNGICITGACGNGFVDARTTGAENERRDRARNESLIYVHSIMEQVDTNKDQSISLDEFQDHVLRTTLIVRKGGAEKPVLEKAAKDFKVMDEDKSGFITLSEIDESAA